MGMSPIQMSQIYWHIYATYATVAFIGSTLQGTRTFSSSNFCHRFVLLFKYSAETDTANHSILLLKNDKGEKLE